MIFRRSCACKARCRLLFKPLSEASSVLLVYRCEADRVRTKTVHIFGTLDVTADTVSVRLQGEITQRTKPNMGFVVAVLATICERRD